MTPLEQFRLKCQEHFTMPHWDTKKAFLFLTEDADLVYFLIRELGSRDDYFTDEQEEDLKYFIERFQNSFNYYDEYKVRTHRVDFTILTLKLLLTLNDEIGEYRYYKGLAQTVPMEYYQDFDHE